MIKTVIFDCWGTLFTSGQSPHPFVTFANTISYSLADRTFVKAFERHLMQDTYDDLSPAIGAMLDELNVSQSTELIQKLKSILGGSIESQVAYPDTLAALQKLKGKYRLVLLTNSFKQGYDGLNKKFDLDSIFDSVITSYTAHAIKPDKKVFVLALEQADCLSNEAIMIGDNLYDDIEPAQMLGMKTLLLDRKGKYPEAPNRIEDLTNIEEVLQQLEERHKSSGNTPSFSN